VVVVMCNALTIDNCISMCVKGGGGCDFPHLVMHWRRVKGQPGE
jgi:hypothetical protein